MPQKKNSDMAELIRGKTGRVYGDLITILTVLKGIPLTYNKDMQEDKECVFDAIDTVKMCLKVFTPMIASMKIRSKNMLKAANIGFMNATDLADYLVKKGIPFRSAYKIAGEIVAHCIKQNCTLDTLPIKEYKKFNTKFEKDLYKQIEITNCVKKRTSAGGTSVQSVNKQIAYIKKALKSI